LTEGHIRLAYAGLHPERRRSLVERYGGVAAVVSRIARGAIEAPAAARSAVAVSADDRREQLQAAGMRLVTLDDDEYPAVLSMLPDAPEVLFVRGRLGAPRGVAVVGTRRCTAYGRALAERYGRAIGEAGWELASELARGIDIAAHRGTVGAGAIGVAVLGCGLDVDYPRGHRPVADRLVDLGGGVVSEYPPGSIPEAWRFPPRNRIIAGLGRATVVVEAAETGGALITASLALDYGRTVFAVPGDVGRATSRGCNLLIRDGAQPVLDPADLVAELELVLGPVGSPPR
jgi:DNA processing protein